MKKVVFFFIFISAVLHGEWRPEFIHDDLSLAVLDNPQYKLLKAKVLHSLKKNYCSPEKAEILMDLVALEKPKICVEIGVFQGGSLLPVAAVLRFFNSGTIYAIDPWSNKEATRNLLDNDPNKKWLASVNMEAVYDSFYHMLKEWSLKKYCVILKMPSNAVVGSIGIIDFLHVDGNYSMEGSLEDVSLYLPKVRKGGYILFSNINWCVNGVLPRIPAFQSLLNDCEIIARIDDWSSYLVRKL